MARRSKNEYLVTVKVGTDIKVTKAAVRFWVLDRILMTDAKENIGKATVQKVAVTRVDME